MQKYVVFDIDGTLLDKGQVECDQETVNLLSKIREQGLEVTVSSGRGWPGVAKLGILPFVKDQLIMLELGSKIYSPQQGEYAAFHQLTRASLADLVSYCAQKEEEWALSFWGNDWKRYVFTVSKTLLDKQDVYKPAEVVHVKTPADFLELIDKVKVTLVRCNGLDAESASFDKSQLGIHPFSSHSGFEVTVAGVDKLSALTEYMSIVEARPEQLYFVGNSQRDIVVKSLLPERNIKIIDKPEKRHSLLREFLTAI